jgi:hypothetical protein
MLITVGCGNVVLLAGVVGKGMADADGLFEGERVGEGGVVGERVGERVGEKVQSTSSNPVRRIGTILVTTPISSNTMLRWNEWRLRVTCPYPSELNVRVI